MLSNKEVNIGSHEETIKVGSIVSTKIHPYQENRIDILITAYAHFTPPLMVVVEKNYGPKFNSDNGEPVDNDSYKCIFYSTLNGCYEFNWFKRREIKLITNDGTENNEEIKNSSLEELKNKLLGKMAVLSSVDLELGKKKIWSDDDEEKQKMKKNNLLDFLPPVGCIIDVKFTEDYQKFNEKNGKPIHKKSKISIKLRWLNNLTSKFSEEYVPSVALKIIDISLMHIDPDLYYYDEIKFNLEGIADIVISKSPLKLKDILFKHYYYVYRLKNTFNDAIFSFNSFNSVKEFSEADEKTVSEILDNNTYEFKTIIKFFDLNNKNHFEKKWFEIQYSDKYGRFSKRIIYINELIIEKSVDEPNKEWAILKANCLLRNGKIRHFSVSRIQGYRELLKDFSDIFVEKKI